MKKHVNIPVFIPHLGCPNQCVFCNQRTISGVNEFDPSGVERVIADAIATVSPDTECEIAFFGGSFTGIGNDLVESLLSVCEHYLSSGKVTSVRCSTRPDYINEEVLDILGRYGVKNVELGIQSASDTVLECSKRGHTLKDTERACKMLIERGFTLGGQMMIGLPGASLSDEIATAKFIVAMGAEEARIYPTVVFRATELCEMTNSGAYEPLTLEDAVERSAEVLDIFINAGIKVLRIGLCDSDNLHSEECYYQGPNHPALGELVENRLYRKKIEKVLATENASGKAVNITVAPGHISKVIGQNKQNKKYFAEKYGISAFKVVESREFSPYGITINIK